MRTIPVFHCFDHQYVLPAAVAFQSMLEHAKSLDTIYELYVVGRDLTDEDRNVLGRIVAAFPQAILTFLEPPELGDFANQATGSRHWNPVLTVDLFYKLAVPELMLAHGIVIVADVDVVYCDDIAKVFECLVAEDDVYVAGGRDLAYARWRHEGLYLDGHPSMSRYFKLYSHEERSRQLLNAGLMVFNCRKLREDGIPERWRQWACSNVRRLILPEQDIINQVCSPRLRALPWNHMAIASAYGDYIKMNERQRAENPIWDEMFAHPVQIHYASGVKPWKFPGSPKADLWFDACVRARLIENWRQWYGDYSRVQTEWALAKSVLSCRMTWGRRWFGVQVVKGKSSK